MTARAPTGSVVTFWNPFLPRLHFDVHEKGAMELRAICHFEAVLQWLEGGSLFLVVDAVNSGTISRSRCDLALTTENGVG